MKLSVGCGLLLVLALLVAPAVAAPAPISVQQTLQATRQQVNQLDTLTQQYLNQTRSAPAPAVQAARQLDQAAARQQQLWDATARLLALRDWTYDDLVQYDAAQAKQGQLTGDDFLRQAQAALESVKRLYQNLQSQPVADAGNPDAQQTLLAIGSYLDSISQKLNQVNHPDTAIAGTRGAGTANDPGQPADPALQQLQALQQLEQKDKRQQTDTRDRIFQNYNAVNQSLRQIGGGKGGVRSPVTPLETPSQPGAAVMPCLGKMPGISGCPAYGPAR